MTAPMTAERAVEIAKVTEAATAGPWATSHVTNYRDDVCAVDGRCLFTTEFLEDAAFIALARTAIPELLAERDRLMREIKRLERDYGDLRLRFDAHRQGERDR